MMRGAPSRPRWRAPLFTLAALTFPVTMAGAQRSAGSQTMDHEYTAKIKEYLQDPRITTELVDHLPTSNTVPTPLTFHGRIVATPGELTYAKDSHRYSAAIGGCAAAAADVPGQVCRAR